jgi:outer membrane PBP1 activator LpoA protein
MTNTLRIILFSSLLAGLTACTVTPPTVDTTPTVNSASAEVRQANSLLRQGKKLEAANLYYKASHKQKSPQRERLILQAAEIASSAKDKSLSLHYLSKLKGIKLSIENTGRQAYVRALIALLDNNHQRALNLLPKQRGKLSGALWSKINRLRQQISKRKGGNGNTSSQHNNSAALPQSSNHIAVLLPLSGKLGSLGNTILKGITAAQQGQAPNTQIKTYDVATADIIGQYQRAVKEGADVIIGPLDKRKLATLISQKSTLSRPIISLNHLSTGQSRAPAALYQFGLAPEDEARQIASFALSRGQKSAVMLYPNSQWGQRLANAFKTLYTSKGGKIIVEKAFPNRSASYKKEVKQVLSVGVKNIDMIFLAAAPTQARLIRPMIQYLHAENVPVYATSHIYSGLPDAGKNMDLNGVIYTEIPYIIEGSQIGTITANSGKYPRLYAMGADALLIAKNLRRMAQSGQPVSGKTGNIRLGGNRLLQRQLSWATFEKGLTTSYGE